MRRPLTQWLLAALLVLGQMLLSVHGADFDAHADGEHCSVCLLGAGQDHIPGPAFEFTLPIVTCCNTRPLAQSRPAQAHPAPYRSRAPPPAHSTPI